MLRGDDSLKDELFCKTLCNNLDIEFSSIKLDVQEVAKSKKLSIEEAARNLRYDNLLKYSENINAHKIVTAHNLEDNTETVLLNLFRGTGLKGASGIPIIRNNIIRPLLSTSKKDILEFLETENIKYRIDKTNFENDFSRNYLRNEIIPKLKEKINSGIDNNVLNFSKIATQSEKAIHDFALNICNKFIHKNESGITISNQITDIEFVNIFPNAVKLGLEKKFNKSFTFEDISKIKKVFALQVGSKVELSNNIIAIKERNYLQIYYKTENNFEDSFELNLSELRQIGSIIISAEIVEEGDVKYSSSKNIEFINGDNILFPLTVRRWRVGDRFNPIGLNGTKTISDFLTDSKTSSKKKKEQLVLLNRGKIIWVVGHRIDEEIKINNKTKRFIKLSVIEKK
jgi:tRNA(Ile)-lysidine synthase